MRQGGAIPGSRVLPRTGCSIRRGAWAPKAKAVRAHLLGRSAGYHRRAVAAGRREYGPEAILPYSYAGTMGLLNGARHGPALLPSPGRIAARPHHLLGGRRRRLMTDARACATAPSPSSSAHSKLILAWGANILGTNVHLWPFIVEARRNGAEFYTIDPRPQSHRRSSPTSTFHSSRAAIWRWRSGLMHVIIGENLHDADYVAQLHQWLRRRCASACRASIRRSASQHSPASPREDDCPARARIRHHAAGRDPAQLWGAAQRARGDGGSRDRGCCRR